MGFELPYGFARDHGVLVAALGAEHAEVLVREDAHPQALAEVRRSVGLPLRLQRVPRALF
ncbi:general secretory pathway protein E, partial [Thauera phenylacetica B4P]